MNYEDLDANGKKWFNAMWDESGGDVNPDTAASHSTDAP